MKLILFLLISLFNCYQINYTIGTNDNIYLIYNNLSYTKFIFEPTLKFNLQYNNVSYFGYINDLCLDNYICCDISNHSYSNVKYDYCYGNYLTSCGNQIFQQCFKGECEKYNSTTYIKYQFTYKDMKCFYQFDIIDYMILFNTNIENYTLNYTLNNIPNYYQILGNVNYFSNLTYYNLSCLLNDVIDNGYLTLDGFNYMNMISSTDYNNCYNYNNLSVKLPYYDYKNLMFNKNIPQLGTFKKKLNSFEVIPTNELFIINFNEEYIVKEKNKGCLIYNIYNNSFRYQLQIECFDDEFKYIKFGIMFENNIYKEYTKNDVDHVYSFYLQSLYKPLYFVNIINKQNIYITSIFINDFIYTNENISGYEDYTNSPIEVVKWTLLVYLLLGMSILFSITLFMLGVFRGWWCIKLVKQINDRYLLRIKQLEDEKEERKNQMIDLINKDDKLSPEAKEDLINNIKYNIYGHNPYKEDIWKIKNEYLPTSVGNMEYNNKTQTTKLNDKYLEKNREEKIKKDKEKNKQQNDNPIIPQNKDMESVSLDDDDENNETEPLQEEKHKFILDKVELRKK